ncbi:glycosyltransferase family 2 protein [Pontibacter pudoricolor]|uniref:glycosyltransferase family 2 protein n=1 Tax=Pontibacter pudoricolor TaxID=2694930 RepID=UPI00139145F9|nr:glycosyltransferase family 2 protein [Pontibacter pudoricolor]
MPRLSAIIICRNEEKDIEGAIQSLLWADEVLIVDSFSTDNTLAIAGNYPVKILQHAFENYSRQRNWALDQAAYDWVLMLDADERITPELQREIQKLLAGTPANSAYTIYRSNFFMGHQVRYSGWQNDSVVRLFDKSRNRYSDKNVHEELIMEDGKPGKLKYKMLHYTYRSLPHYLDKWNTYSTLSANDKAKKTKKVSLYHLMLKPAFRFFRHYIFKLGILDGKVGFVISYLSASSIFMRYLKIWRMQQENITLK